MVNAEGQSFTLDGGYAVGTMPVYGMDFIVDGGPSPLQFLVDSSASFTCIATGENSRIMEFSATGEKASGFISAGEDEEGWKSITFDDRERIFKEP